MATTTATTTTIMTMKKKRGPKFRALEPWQRLIIEEEKSPQKLHRKLPKR